MDWSDPARQVTVRQPHVTPASWLHLLATRLGVSWSEITRADSQRKVTPTRQVSNQSILIPAAQSRFLPRLNISPRTALMVGLGLTQIGEFSYVLVRVARDAQPGYRRYLSRDSGGFRDHDPVQWPVNEGAAQDSGAGLDCQQTSQVDPGGANPARIPLHPLF